jgi:hypothetical protein
MGTRASPRRARFSDTGEIISVTPSYNLAIPGLGLRPVHL